MTMTMRKWAGVVAVCVLAGQAGLVAQSTDKPPLYRRLGGYDAIAAVTDDFIGRLATDADLGVFFKGHSTDAKMHIRQLVVDQLCAATGGPCVYIGKSMRQAHAGLGITDAQWTRSVELLTASLDKFKVPKAEQNDLLTIASSLKSDIVEK